MYMCDVLEDVPDVPDVPDGFHSGFTWLEAVGRMAAETEAAETAAVATTEVGGSVGVMMEVEAKAVEARVVAAETVVAAMEEEAARDLSSN